MKLVRGKEVFPGIMLYENVIENPQRIIDLAQSMPQAWQDSTLSAEDPTGRLNKEYRNSRGLEMTTHLSSPVEWFEVSKIIFSYAEDYSLHTGAMFSAMENVQMLHYKNSNGFYKAHIDDGPLNPRVFSALLYLNTVESGGETYFTKFDHEVKPIAGNLVFFPATIPYDHQAHIPKSEDKFVLVTWFNPLIAEGVR